MDVLSLNQCCSVLFSTLISRDMDDEKIEYPNIMINNIALVTLTESGNIPAPLAAYPSCCVTNLKMKFKR